MITGTFILVITTINPFIIATIKGTVVPVSISRRLNTRNHGYNNTRNNAQIFSIETCSAQHVTLPAQPKYILYDADAHWLHDLNSFEEILPDSFLPPYIVLIVSTILIRNLGKYILSIADEIDGVCNALKDVNFPITSHDLELTSHRVFNWQR